MSGAELRTLGAFPEPAFTELRIAAFEGFGVQSALLSEVLADEAERRSSPSASGEEHTRKLRIGAFLDGQLVGWSYSQEQGDELHMINSGVHPRFRCRGIYRELVTQTISYAGTQGFVKIVSRHVPTNNHVIIPKLRLGFMVSAFEYSEIYGPLVHLTYLVGSQRRHLYQARARPIIPD